MFEVLTAVASLPEVLTAEASLIEDTAAETTVHGALVGVQAVFGDNCAHCHPLCTLLNDFPCYFASPAV